MRIIYLKLAGYAGIKAGMDLDVIEIDFAQARHQICVIKGDNGSGKSTILNSLSPVNDPPTKFIPGKLAEKYIKYLLDDGTVLAIYYYSPVIANVRSNKVYVRLYKDIMSDSFVDLNPNGNMTEGKNIIFEKLGIDNDFLLLSQLSSEDRGLVDKSPTDRKKFINRKLNQLDFYNNLYRKITAKHSEMKSLLKSIDVKITELGSVEEIKTLIHSQTISLGSMEDTRNELIARYAANQERLNSFEKYDRPIAEIYKEVDSTMADALQRVYDCDKLLEKYEAFKDLDVNKLKEDLESSKTALIQKDAELSNYRMTKTMLYKTIQTNEEKLKNLGYTENFDKVQALFQEKRDQVMVYQDILRNLGFDFNDANSESEITVEEYESALNSVEIFNNKLQRITDLYPSMYREAMLDEAEQKELLLGTDQKVEEDLKAQVKRLQALLQEQDVFAQFSKTYEQIPKDCTHLSDCPFIQKTVKAKCSLLSDKQIEFVHENLKTIEKTIEDNKKRNEVKATMLACINDYNDLLLSIDVKALSKFPGMDWMTSKREIYKALLYGTCIRLDLHDYREKTNVLSQMLAEKEVLKKLSQQIEMYKNSKPAIDLLESSIRNDKTKYEYISGKIERLEDEIAQYNQDVDALEDTIFRCKTRDEILEERAKYKEISKTYGDRFTSLRKEMEEMRDIKETMEIIHNKMEYLNSSEIPKLQDELQKNKYKMVLYNSYLEDYEKYSKEIQWIEKIKYYVSPSTGIQTVYMEMFMNEILVTANSLLHSFFGGEFVLQPFVINEKEFRIPCLGHLMMHDDVTSMSTAQICMISMILSFALFGTNAGPYSIIKLDEIDGGLDYNNRIQFINVLQNLMMMLRYEQCIMISHNSELALYNADVILLKNSDHSLNLNGANVIWRYDND